MAIKVNLKELAKLILDDCPIIIQEYDTELVIMQTDMDYEIIDDYLASRTKNGYIITELDYELLRDQLEVFIKKEIHTRINNQLKMLDAEDLKIFDKSIHEYEEEQDGC